MYIPNEFKVTDQEKVYQFIRKNSFGLLLTSVNDEIFNSQIPFIIKPEGDSFILYGHLSRNNDQWKTSENKKVTVLFLGPHHYISPRWYTIESSVPTWDYATVKINGILELLERSQTELLLKELSLEFDPEWAALQKEKEDYYQKMIEEIVGFRIKVTEIFAKWKMSQNRPVEDITKVLDNLNKIPHSDAKETAHEILESNLSRLTRTKL